MSAGPSEGWGTAWRLVWPKGSEQKPRRWRGAELGLVGLGGFCSDSDWDPQKGLSREGTWSGLHF